MKSHRVATIMMAAFALTFVIGLSCQPKPRQLNVKAFGAIRKGMSQAEVEFILGGPPGNYGRYTADDVVVQGGGIHECIGPLSIKAWTDDDNKIEIGFDRDGRVAAFQPDATYIQLPPRWVRWCWKVFRG